MSTHLRFYLLALAASTSCTLGAKHRGTRALSPDTVVDTVTLSLTAPSSQQTLARSLISISIEGDRWAEWAGINSTNTFFTNCLKNLGSITGRMPEVRVGADSEDHTTFDAGVNVVSETFPAYTSTVPYPEASKVQVSSAFYDLSKRMPSGTSMTWGVNFGGGDSSVAIAQAQAIMSTFSAGGAAYEAGVILEAIEIGNEADLYKNNGLRSSTWDINQYKAQWETFAQDIIDAVGLEPDTAPRLWLASFAGSTDTASGFSPQTLYSQGVVSGPFGQYINTVSQHHYSGSFCSGNGGLLSDLMDKTGIRGNISSFDNDIAATVSRGLTYVLGETNSYSCHGSPGVSNTAGAAIWALDYALQAATHGVRRVYFHDGIGYKYNLIQPVTLTRSITTGATLSTPLAPHVQPQYYAGIVANTFIGNSQSNTIDTYIVELTVDSPNVGGYAAYDNGVLSRAVFINNKAWLNGAIGTRGSSQLAFTTSGSGTKPTSMQVRRLTIGYADDTSGVTFAGKSYETSTGLPSGTDTYTTAAITDQVKISDTEAIVITFIY